MKTKWAVLILLIAWALLCFDIAAPWHGHQDDNGVWISETVEAGTLVPLRSSGYYTHHPPLIVWLSQLAARAFGFSTLSLRFVVAVFTILSIATIYGIGRKWLGNGTWPAALYAFTPMMAYFGRMPDHEAPTLAIIALLVFILSVRPESHLAIIVLSALAALTSWAGMLFALAIFGIMWLRERRWIYIFCALVLIGTLGLVLALYELKAPGALTDLGHSFLYRTSDNSAGVDSAPITLGMFFQRYATHMGLLLGPAWLILSILGMRKLWRNPLWIVLATSGLLYILLLRNAAYIHDYYKIYFTPAMSLSAGASVQFGLHTHWRKMIVVALAATGGMGIAVFLVLHGYFA
jgi:4-amino-4-deoxy-L-arabinose transferase-like glycosyltransferase